MGGFIEHTSLTWDWLQPRATPVHTRRPRSQQRQDPLLQWLGAHPFHDPMDSVPKKQTSETKNGVKKLTVLWLCPL